MKLPKLPKRPQEPKPQVEAAQRPDQAPSRQNGEEPGTQAGPGATATGSSQPRNGVDTLARQVGPWLRWAISRSANRLPLILAGLALALAVAGVFLPRRSKPSPELLLDIALLYQSAGKTREASARLDEAVAAGMHDTEMLGRAGDLYRQLGRYRRAVRILEPVVASEPTRKDYRLNLARSYFGASEHDKAVEQYLELIAQAPELVVAHMELGNTYQAMYQLDLALAEYQRVVELIPGQMEGYYAQGELYRLKLGDNEKAAEQYRLGLEVEPLDSYGYLAQVYYGACLTALGRLEEAMEQLQAAEAAYPAYASAPYYLGRAYEAQGSLSDAQLAYSRALSLKSDFPDARLALGNLYIRMRDCPEAIVQFRKILALQPDNLDARIGLARCKSVY